MIKKLGIGLAIVLTSLSLSGCLFFGHKKPVAVAPTTETEPDKILFERGTAEIEKGHYDVGRLTLQTLINTYPDSDYLAKAKLAIADSFYKQGGTSGLVQAKAEYKDFITFFPNDPDAAEAQMKAAMTNYRQMEKPDRDRTQALAAEEEFRFMLAQYPKSQYAPEAQQRLREVQEVLAEGNFEVGRQYFIRRAYRAAISRFQETLQKYPDYSGQDETLYLLGESYERSNNDRLAADSYAKIVEYFPDCDYFKKAKERLTDLNQPIPATDPKAIEIAKQEEANRPHKGILGNMWGMFRKSPDVSLARTTPSPLPPMKTETAANQPPVGAGEPAAGATADISVGPVSTSSGTTNSSSSGSSAGTATNPSTDSGKEASQPAAAPNSTGDQSQPAASSGNKSSQSDKSSSTGKGKSSSKKKKGLKKIWPF